MCEFRRSEITKHTKNRNELLTRLFIKVEEILDSNYSPARSVPRVFGSVKSVRKEVHKKAAGISSFRNHSSRNRTD